MWPIAPSYPTKKMALEYRPYIRRPTRNRHAAHSLPTLRCPAGIPSAKRALATGAKPGTPEFRTALRDALVSTKDVVGTHGIYNFHTGSSFGVDKRALVLVKLVDSKWRLLQ